MIDRRVVLGWLAAGASLPFTGVPRMANGAGFRGSSELVRSTRYPLASARAIGMAYLAEAPGEANPAVLEERIRIALTAAEGAAPASLRASLEWRLEECIRRDFAAGELVAVKGWMLARLEARLCALIALTA